MVTVINTAKVNQQTVEIIKAEAERLQLLGYKVPAEIKIKDLPASLGLAGTMKRMYISPKAENFSLKFVVRHEIGHHNEPERTIDIWNLKTIEEETQESEDFANNFAYMTK